MTSTTLIPLRLSQAKPDFESILMQLQLFVQSRGSWDDLLTSSTGETLLEMAASAATFNMFGLEGAQRETYLSTAFRESSVYAITRMLGVRVTRKTSASVMVTLKRADYSTMQVVPKFTQFELGGRPFFNREMILLPQGQVEIPGIVLYEGEVRVQTIKSDATSFREIYLNERNFIVSNSDLEVSIIDPSTGDSEIWLPTDDGIWIAGPYDKVYYDSTSGFGDTILQFGDGYHGSLPNYGYDIQIRYVVTKGSAGNNGVEGLEVKQSAYGLTGVTTSNVTGGADEKNARFYQALAPHIYKARSRAVNRPDYKAIACSYPGVASAAVQAQKDVAPWDLRWMNVVRICILPQDQDSFTDAQWKDFLTWFQKRHHAAIAIQKYNPLKIIRDVELVLALRNNSTPNDTVPVVESAIRALFARSLDTLGKRIAVSDILRCCDITGVDYADMVTPMADMLLPDELSYFELGTLKISTRYSEREIYAERRG